MYSSRMEKDDVYWKSVHAKAADQLSDLLAERDLLSEQLTYVNKEIIWTEQMLSALQQLTSDEKDGSVAAVEGVADLPLAQACRTILQNSTTHRTARGIRDSLEASGYDLSQHNNPLASIHGVLKRLVESGQAEQIESNGKMRFRWKPEFTIGFKEAFNRKRLTREEEALEAERRDLQRLVDRGLGGLGAKSQKSDSGLNSLKKKD